VRRRSSNWIVITLVAVVLASLAVGVRAAQQNPPAKQSVWDGVYTDIQASRGERQYGRACEHCHGADMAGDPVQEIPALSLDSFMTAWSGRNVKDLFDTVKRSMPKDKPGTLGTGAYVDVVAYLLQANRFPSGPRELPRAPEQLETITIERK
jgi:S-disulfanyl-L-cysteine oxidoreductase SoxD